MESLYTSDGRKYEGMSQATVQALLTAAGLTCTFVTKEEYDVFLATHVVIRSTPAQILTQERDSAILELLNSTSSFAKLLRAVVLIMLDEINIVRGLTAQTPRTINQLKTAISNKINAGTAD